MGREKEDKQNENRRGKAVYIMRGKQRERESVCWQKKILYKENRYTVKKNGEKNHGN